MVWYRGNRRKGQPINHQQTNIAQSGQTIGRLAYFFYLLLYALVYGSFLYYTTKNLDDIVNHLIHFELSYSVKVAGILSAVLIIVWFILLAATVWRGRDIGFAKWQSILLYLIPSLPRAVAMLFAIDVFGNWMDIMAIVLWLPISILFVYLPKDWMYRRKNRSIVKD